MQVPTQDSQQETNREQPEPNPLLAIMELAVKGAYNDGLIRGAIMGVVLSTSLITAGALIYPLL